MKHRLGPHRAFLFAAFATTVASCSNATSMAPTPAVEPATVEVRVSLPGGHDEMRRARYISAATKSIGIVIRSSTGDSSPTAFANCSTSCDVSTTAPLGRATVVATLYDGSLGTGHALSIGSSAVALEAGTNVLHLNFDGVFARGVLNLGGAVPTIGTASSIGSVFTAEDVDGSRIIGPEKFASASGAPIAVDLTNSDTTGHSRLSPTTVTSPTDVTLAFDGHATSGIVTQHSTVGTSSAPFVTYLPKEQYVSLRAPWPRTLGIGSDRNLWFVVPGAVGRRNQDGSFTIFRSPKDAAINYSSELKPAADGAFWLIATVNSTAEFERVTTSGTFTPFPLPFGFEGRLEESVVGADGAVWFLVDPEGNQTANQLGRIDNRGTVTLFRVPSFYSHASNLVVGPDKHLWFYLFDDAGGKGILRFVNGQFSGYAAPAGAPPFFTGPDDSLWFPFVSGNSLVKMNANGHVVATIALPRCPAWNLNCSRSFGSPSTDTHHDVWFADAAANAIGRFEANELVEYPVFPDSSFPASVAASPDGEVYYGDFGTSGPSGNRGGGLGTLDPSFW